MPGETWVSSFSEASICPLPGVKRAWQTLAMDINNRLYVEIHPFEGPHAPHPDPIRDARFDPAYVYKVLGMYNPSETSECYFILSNPARQIWFIPQRHLLAYKLIDSDEFFLPIATLDHPNSSRWRDGATRHPVPT